METTVEGFCNALSRCQFLPGERIRDLRQRWRQEAGAAASSLEQFTAWLVSRHIMTEYQASVIGRGNGDQLYIGPYRIVERVGRGRLAGVYKATHASGMIVAVKVLPPSKAAQPLVFARFQREVKLALSVQHPNVVRSYHSGEHKGLHYLTMEHLEGETFAEALARPKRLSVGEAVAVVYQALLGLQAIHEQGLVHRDLSPGNLMLIGGEPHSTVGALVKILDLGTGRALFDDEEGSPQFDLTRPGEMLGTSDYMSPEQAKDAHNIDVRTDIYTLGCVLYHALAGEPPFVDVSAVRKLLRHATEEPRPITQRNPQVPPALQQVLDWMMAKDPAKRYPTPTRAAQALEMFVAANSDFAPRPDAQMDAYLEWVTTYAGNAGEPAPTAPGSRPTTAVKKPASPSPPMASPAREQIPVIEVELVSAPVAASPPVARPVAASPPVARLVGKEEPPRSRRKVVREEEPEAPAGLMGLSPREMLLLALGLLGVIGLGVLALLAWVAYRLMS